MKAALFYGPKDIRVGEIETPTLLPDDRFNVLIRVKAAGVCGSDLHFYKGETPSRLQERSVLGHELSGEVVAVGAGVDKVRVGDRVGVEPLIGCGKCNFCLTGQYHLCRGLNHIGYYYPGGFAEYTKAPQNNVYRLPNNVSCEDACLLDCYAVSVHGLNRIPVNVNDVVVIIGGGPLGITTAQVVKAHGARKVILIDLLDEVLAVAKKAGIDDTLNAAKTDAVNEVRKLTQGSGADIVFETVGGTAPTLDQAIAMVRPGGTVGLIGIRNEGSMNSRDAHTKEINMIFVWSYATWGIESEFGIALNLLSAGRIKATPLITHTFTLGDIKEAFETALNKKDSKAVKVLIKP